MGIIDWFTEPKSTEEIGSRKRKERIGTFNRQTK